MGDPPGYFCHTKMLNPTKKFILANQQDAKLRRFYEITYAKRTAEELYLIASDPDCLNNLAADPNQSQALVQLRSRLDSILKEQGDPRLLGDGDIFEGYPFFGRMQPGLGGFEERGEYNRQFASPNPR